MAFARTFRRLFIAWTIGERVEFSLSRILQTLIYAPVVGQGWSSG